MYNYHTGEIKNKGLLTMISIIQILAYLLLGAILSATLALVGIPFVVGGTLGGLVVVGLFISRSFFETVIHTCPHCQNQVRSLRDFGHYECSVCGKSSEVTTGNAFQVKKINEEQVSASV